MTLRERIADFAARIPLSDLHICSGRPIAMRVDGEILIDLGEPVRVESFANFLDEVLPDGVPERFQIEKDLDLALELDGTRYRINLFQTMRGAAAVLRRIASHIPSLDDLGLPGVMRQVLAEKNGLVLVTGPAGSGKSTTVAAMLAAISQSRPAHIITLEDPIEFVHDDGVGLVSQREIGRDTHSFASALRATLREDPDVIQVGELRDQETLQLALTAAETGHLVLATLHTRSAPEAIHRFIDVFPASRQDQVRTQLAQTLRLIMAQRLVRRKEGRGRVAACEVMTCNTAVRNLIRENKVHQLASVMQTARGEGMQTLEQALQALIQAGVIDPHTA